MESIAILGAGSWGTTLAVIYARAGRDVALWDRDAARARALQAERENARYLPAVRLPDGVHVMSDMAAAVCDRPLVVLAVPAQAVRGVATEVGPCLMPGAVVVIAAKGLEIGSGRRMSA